MNVLPRRRLHYARDSRLGRFLPTHLPEAVAAGISVNGAWWVDADDHDDGAYIDVSDIDKDNPDHMRVGRQAGMPDGTDGGFVRNEVAEIPEGLTPIIY